MMIDNRDQRFDKENPSLIGYLCDRRFGIGADGVILIEHDAESDFKMVYYNPDGSQSLCGNGSRCAVMFARQLGLIDTEAKFNAYDGLHYAFIKGDRVHLEMHDVDGVEKNELGYLVDTGSPHLVKMVENLENLDVRAEGSNIRFSERFKAEGININFVEEVNQETSIRTYERGVEDETLSCGTGCTAVALALSETGASSPVTLNAKGGTLQVSFERDGGAFKNIYLIGPAKKSFSGEIEV